MGKSSIRTGVAKDTSGTHVKNLGWMSESGKKQHRFYLGKNAAEALVRAARLEQVWAAIEDRWRRRPEGAARPIWDRWSLSIGQAVSRGEAVCQVELPAKLPDLRLDSPNPETVTIETFDDRNPTVIAYWLREVQADFRFIRVVL